MNRKLKGHLLFLIIVIATSCTIKESLPSVKTVEEAKTLLINKKWTASDVGIQTVSEGVTSVEWFREGKETEGYKLTTRDKFINAWLELRADTVAHSGGLEFTGDQTYELTDKVQEGTDTPPGVRLELSGASDIFKDMGVTSASMTYYVLGVDEKKLLLKTPQTIDKNYIVLMMEAK